MARKTNASTTSNKPSPEPETTAPETTVSESTETPTPDPIPETTDPESPPLPTTTETETTEQSPDFSSEFSGDHLDAIADDDAPDPDTNARTVEFTDEATGKTVELYTMPAFRVAFCGVFDGAAMLPEMMGGEPFKSLAIAPGEKARAEAAADAFYRMAIRNRLLRYTLRPGSQGAKDFLALACFALPKASAVASEMRVRQAVHEHAMQQAEQAAVAEHDQQQQAHVAAA